MYSNLVNVSAEEMTTRVKKYSPSDFVFQRADENTAQYLARLDQMKDYDKVRKQLREFFIQANLDSLELGWGQQLILSHHLLNYKDKNRLLKFAEQFGLNGLRVISSADYDNKILNQTLELSEKEPEFFKKLSQEYYIFLENIEQATEDIRKIPEIFDSPDKILKDDFPKELQEAFLRRAKDLILATELSVTQTEQQDHLGVFRAINLLAEMILEVFQDNLSKSYFKYRLESSHNNSFVFHVTDSQDMEYRLKMFFRPEANNEGQARINFELDFNTAVPNQKLLKLFKQTITTSQTNLPRETSSLRVALDLEDRVSNQAVSLDLGRSIYEGKTMSRSGDKLGNLLQQVSDSGSHNLDSFSKVMVPYFSKLANLFLEKTKVVAEKLSQSPDQHSARAGQR